MNKAKKYEEPEGVKQVLNELEELLKTNYCIKGVEPPFKTPLDVGKAMEKILFIVGKKYPNIEIFNYNDYSIIGRDVMIGPKKLHILKLFTDYYYLSATDLLKLFGYYFYSYYNEEKIKLYLEENIIVINKYLENNDINLLILIIDKKIDNTIDYWGSVELKLYIIFIFNKYYQEKITSHQIFQILNTEKDYVL
jgi:hypothetical protein